MDKNRKGRRAVELVKDGFIVLLTCSALWLAARSQLLGPLSDFWKDEAPQTGLVQAQSGTRADAARPLRMTASLQRGTETVRYGVQYDADTSDALFQQVAGLLVEALSSAGEPERITRAQWERAQLTAPGVTFDFQGELPMPVLVSWLSGEDTNLTAAVRRLTLTVWQETVALYYRDEESGLYYRCLSEMASERQLTQALSALGGNGAVWAFESEQYQSLDPDTLVTGNVPTPAVYTAANPMAGGQSALEELMTDLGFSVNSSSFYASGDELVGRSGNDGIRLSDQGVAEYLAGEASDHFLVPTSQGEATLAESVEACRQLAAATVGSRCGQARLYLISAQETGEGLEVQFGYCLNGTVVRLEEGCAARFLVQDGRITQFKLCFRSYTDSGETSVVMPVRQAIAALEALDLEGEELLLVYSDNGGDKVTAAWAAGGSVAGER